ncbi:MAG: hypothetical protein AAGF46_10260, partial [Pseudomonadota bacterium]
MTNALQSYSAAAPLPSFGVRFPHEMKNERATWLVTIGLAGVNEAAVRQDFGPLPARLSVTGRVRRLCGCASRAGAWRSRSHQGR